MKEFPIVKLDHPNRQVVAKKVIDSVPLDDGMQMRIEKEKKQRTLKQNAAIHKYFSLLAQALNDAGYDMKKVLRPEIDISWNEYMVKEYLWRGLQKAMTGKVSTTELETHEISKVYEELNRHLASKLGISVPFPEKLPEEYEQYQKGA